MKRVVIIGGGFGGVSVACTLAKKMKHEDCEILIIDEKERHVYTPWLYEVATAVYPAKGIPEIEKAKRRASVPMGLFLQTKNIRFLQSRVTNIAKNGKSITCKNGEEIRADVVVIAVGSRTNDFGISGVKTYAHTLKTPEEAEQIAIQFERVLRDAEREKKQKTIVVVGGGANGVELVAEMAVVQRAFFQKQERKIQGVRIVLCDGGSEPVGMFHASVRKKVAQRLRKIGVEFFAKTGVQEVKAGEVIAQNVTIPFDLLIWSAGVRSREEPGEIWGMPVNERGRIKVQEDFLVEGRENIFALGDAAARNGNRPDPQSAQVASAQAPYVAENIYAHLHGRQTKKMSEKKWQTLLAVGGSYGVGRIFGIPIAGKVAFMLRRLVDLKYFLSIFPIQIAVVLWYRGVETYGENDASQA